MCQRCGSYFLVSNNFWHLPTIPYSDIYPGYSLSLPLPPSLSLRGLSYPLSPPFLPVPLPPTPNHLHNNYVSALAWVGAATWITVWKNHCLVMLTGKIVANLSVCVFFNGMSTLLHNTHRITYATFCVHPWPSGDKAWPCTWPLVMWDQEKQKC